MSIEAKIELLTTAINGLTAVVQGLSLGEAASAPAAEEPADDGKAKKEAAAKAKKAAEAKAKKAAAEAKAKKQAEEEAALLDDDAGEGEAKVTVDQLKEKTLKCIRGGKGAQATAILKEYDAEKVSGLKAEDYEEVYEKLNAL